MLLKALFIPFTLFLAHSLIASHANAQIPNQTQTQTEPAKLNNVNSVPSLPIAEFMVQAVRLSEYSPELATSQLKLNAEQMSELNIAEQYLLHMVKANISWANNQTTEVIKHLTDTEQLASSVPILQLQSDLFNQANLLLSKAYASMQRFELAYKSKQRYLTHYFNHIDSIREQDVAQLKEKYATSHKAKESVLLQKRSQITQQKIAETRQAKDAYQREKIIIMLISLVFLGMLIRQFLLSKDLKTLAQKDNLTGLLNRRNVFMRGKALVENFHSNQQSFCLLMLDIDNFKNINDTYGHDTGDQVLKHIAKVGKKVMRNRDVFARIGGEEFVALFPATNIVNSHLIAERFRENLQKANFKSLGIEQPITASFGLACVSLTHADFDALLNAADQAMYQAKNQGRNQVVKYTP